MTQANPSKNSNSAFDPAYVRAVKVWHLLAGTVLVCIYVDAFLTKTLTRYLAIAAPICGPAFLACATYIQFRPTEASRIAGIGYYFLAGYFTVAYAFALYIGPWDYSYLIFSNAIWASTVYLYASLFLGRRSKVAGIATAAVNSTLTIACAVRFVLAGYPTRTEQFGLQPYFYSLLAQWVMLAGAQVINQLYSTMRDSERQVIFLRQVVAEMVGHEIGTPLQTMVNNVSLLQILFKRMSPASNAQGTEERVRKALDNLDRSVQQVERVLANAAETTTGLQAPHSATPAVEEVNMPQLLQFVMEAFRSRTNANNVALLLDQTVVIPNSVVTDRTRVVQIVTNLLSNAVKYTDSGKILLHCSSPRTGVLQICVDDSGIGIPDDALDTIFEPYVRLPEAKQRLTPGSGLGLAVVKRELSTLGGDISVRSIHGKGSSFTVTIPASVYSFLGRPTMERYEVLVIDDSLEALSTAKELLDGPEFGCQTAEDGEAALSRLSSNVYDLIFLDVFMPGMNGHEVLKRLRTDPKYARNQAVPVVGMSSSPAADSEAQAFNFFLKKPFTFSPELVSRFLTRPHRMSELGSGLSGDHPE